VRRALIIIGLLIMLAGILWPWLVKSGLWRWFGRLPGDIRIDREGFSFFFPIMTMIVVSVVISLVLWLVRR
jgi:hypothetical protein